MTRARRASLLIVEDDPDVRDALAELLEDEGFQVTQARDGVEGLRALGRSPDLVILDLMLPVVNGWTVLAWMREHLNPAPPVLILSGAGRERALGFADVPEVAFLPKPADADEIVGVLRDLHALAWTATEGARRQAPRRGRRDVAGEAAS